MHNSFHSNLNALSPESTVTSLLSSSGHITSILQPSALSSSFTYKDKEYQSASAALDAYITDFERSRHGDTLLRVGLDHSSHISMPPSSPLQMPWSTLRNRDVLKERLSKRELDFLSLPVSSLRHRGNRDRISMTTDELLSIPNDGSMPVTHTSALIHGLVSRSGASKVRSSVKPTCSQSQDPRAAKPIRTLHCPRCGGGAQMTNREPPLSSTVQHEPSSSAQGAGCPSFTPLSDWPSGREQATMHLPHWLSSNKAAVDCSEIGSLPDIPYPPWIQHCSTDQSECSYGSGQSQIRHGGQSEGSEIEDFPASAPSWVLELDDDRLADSELTLRNLRLQFAEHISQLASERSGLDSLNLLHKDKKMESLIQKADQVLDSLQSSATGSPVPAPDRTQDLLLQDLDPTTQLSGAVGTQPGALEAIKQILFRLEAVETELQRRQSLQQGALKESVSSLQKSGQQGAPHSSQWQSENTLKGKEQVALDPHEDDGGPSLQRALVHLSRLKLLVEKPEEEEKDEGRFSSSSTEDRTAEETH